jgi:hypothetical protein
MGGADRAEQIGVVIAKLVAVKKKEGRESGRLYLS